jgi:two-component system OmpR family response regulator
VKVLIVDDDAEFREFTTVAMAAAGISYESAEDAEGGLALMREKTFDLILLDVRMPGASGMSLLMQIREAGNETPVIFVTGVGDVDDRVKGLQLGADDYIVKPVAYDELIARMEAVLRRRQSLAPIEFGDLSLDLARRKVERAGQPINLSPREYDLLFALVSAKGEVISRKDLMSDVWNMDFDPGTNVLDVHIGRLRKKLDRQGRPLIKTVRGQGYCIARYDTP